jgi:hypothetical protein
MHRNRRLLTLTSLLAALSVSAAVADQAAFTAKVAGTADLIGYWSFEGNMNDTSGKNNHVTTVGDPSQITTCEGVKGGQGIQINNKAKTGQFLQIQSPIGSIFDTQKVTVITWAKNDFIPAEGTWHSLVDRNSLWYISLEAKEDRGGSPGFDVVMRIYDPANPTAGGTPQVRDETVFVRANEWHMYAFTYDGEVLINYLDGKEVHRYEFADGIGPTADTPTDPKHKNYNITWGAWQQRDDWFSGCFDDTAIVSRAMTAADIKALYDAMMQ